MSKGIFDKHTLERLLEHIKQNSTPEAEARLLEERRLIFNDVVERYGKKKAKESTEKEMIRKLLCKVLGHRWRPFFYVLPSKLKCLPSMGCVRCNAIRDI